MDESQSMDQEHRWLPGMIESLDNNLKRLGIGADQERPNLFAIVGFGLQKSFTDRGLPRIMTTDDGNDTFTASEAAEVAAKLIGKGRIEDGYLAISDAIKNVSWPAHRPMLGRSANGISKNLIFITDEDRDIILPEGANLTRQTIKRLLRRNNIIPNFVLDQNFIANGQPAIGMDYTRTGYVATEECDHFAVAKDVYPGIGYANTRRDYTRLVLEESVHGAAWDINILRTGGCSSQAFTAAFVDLKVEETSDNLNDIECHRCRCTADRGFVCARDEDQRRCCRRTGGKVSAYC